MTEQELRNKLYQYDNHEYWECLERNKTKERELHKLYQEIKILNEKHRTTPKHLMPQAMTRQMWKKDKDWRKHKEVTQNALCNKIK